MEEGTYEYFEAIAFRLQDAGIDAYAEQMGGGIICVWVKCGEYQLVFGTANETWGADVYKGEEFQDGNYVETNERVTGDPSEAAQIITRATATFKEVSQS